LSIHTNQSEEQSAFATGSGDLDNGFTLLIRMFSSLSDKQKGIAVLVQVELEMMFEIIGAGL
jgi:hypothetical protein